MAAQVPATLPLPSSLLGQAATQFDHFEISPPRHPLNGPVTQFLRQHLSFLVPSHSHIPPVVEVVPGRKFTRLAAVNLPEYKKVNDTRHPPQAGVPEDIDSSDVDSLPDVHWCKALLCYYSCWSHGRLRVPPRWRLERVNTPRQDGTTNTSGSGSGAHARSLTFTYFISYYLLLDRERTTSSVHPARVKLLDAACQLAVHLRTPGLTAMRNSGFLRYMIDEPLAEISIIALAMLSRDLDDLARTLSGTYMNQWYNLFILTHKSPVHIRRGHVLF
ncbi:hypothetical protein DEU56DRAFT_760425 [Suillus clintonianus]|uniref:uncharacterized protein n=1 Tax=Suillus clintonianus TaxID=1904413 RepID=UPI001B85D6F0|nr:uncharacterized protein DEU56DRAFT_760425 [Suillus clintonianus]KAG2122244.1 hypothetical protein DEU56DRAFT_760425 [Suillus clintonianus]